MRVRSLTSPVEKKFGARELSYGVVYALVLLWINAYICRELFVNQTAKMNSMHGFWMAVARLADGSWFHATWWPYWDCGIPFEFTYAPLVPAMTAAWAALRGVPHALAFNSVTGVFYCLLPVNLFLMAWLLTRAPGYSFLAGLFYSLTAPTELVLPDSNFALTHLGDARRLYLASVWDESPHLAALAILPLIVLFLSLSIRRRRIVYYIASAVSIAIAALLSAFGPMIVIMAALCLLFVVQREEYKRNLVLLILIGAFAYAIAAPYLSPSQIQAISAASKESEGGWSMGSLTALAMVALGWTILWRYLPRWTQDWPLQFFALFAYLTSSIPIVFTYLHRQFVPQPGRYKVEMEFALALIVVFAARRLLEKAPTSLKAALLFLILAVAGEQIVSLRRFAKIILAPVDVTTTIEYQASKWAEANLPGVRVMLPGSIAQWANAFTELRQFSGSSWSIAVNPIQQRGFREIYNGDAQVSLSWLKAYGVGAVAVSGPHSSEFWKAFQHPEKFEGVLPVLWREDDVTIYRVPQRFASLAHVIPESAVARDPEATEQYIAALDDPSLPLAELEWQGRNHINIRTAASPRQAIFVQVTYHPGWRAKVNGQARQIQQDGLGLMWIRPECNGPCNVELDYDGGWELRICRYLSFAAMASLLLFPILVLGRKARRGGSKTLESASIRTSGPLSE
jgi:hypothetical protein